MTYEKR